MRTSFGNSLEVNGIQHFNNAISRFSNSFSTLPRLEEMSLFKYPFFNLNSLTNLKEFSVLRFSWTTDFETFSKGCPKLERLVLLTANFNTILPFIRHSKRLKSIKIAQQSRGLDLFALNEERKKLENDADVVLCVPDYFYLSAKWKPRNLNMNFVKITRLDSFAVLGIL